MLLGFKKQFVPKILNGSKGFTLRNKPKRMPKEGEQLHMYTGLRTTHCSLITREFSLKRPRRVILRIDLDKSIMTINVEGKRIPVDKVHEFVVMDGFDSVYDFLKYWTENAKHKQVKAILYMFPWQDIDHLFKESMYSRLDRIFDVEIWKKNKSQN
jgi:hypothetical protein